MKPRCDDRCRKALRLECHCVCGGKNHGTALKRPRQIRIEFEDSSPGGKPPDDGPPPEKD